MVDRAPDNRMAGINGHPPQPEFPMPKPLSVGQLAQLIAVLSIGLLSISALLGMMGAVATMTYRSMIGAFYGH